MEFATDNNDLVWDLDAFQEREKAIEFVMRFENKLCIYSGAVGQMYSNYNIFFPKEENRNLVILPNPYAHHDTFNNVNEDAVTPTGLRIISGKLSGKDCLFLAIPFKSGRTRYRTVPLQVGLRILQNQRGGKAFLPVLKKGDLREMKTQHPCLHLHSIDIEKLTKVSELDSQGIANVIGQRVRTLV